MIKQMNGCILHTFRSAGYAKDILRWSSTKGVMISTSLCEKNVDLKEIEEQLWGHSRFPKKNRGLM
jgi:hypothetical protein